MAALLPWDSRPTLGLRDHLTAERLGNSLSPAPVLRPLHGFFLIASLQIKTHAVMEQRRCLRVCWALCDCLLVATCRPRHVLS